PGDTLTSLRFAVGLRKLKSNYNGFSIRLRRSTDNAVQNFGFVGFEIDTVAIKAWLGSATGFVETFFDQSGFNNHVSQTNAAQQPTLVINGFNGRPVLRFNSSQFLVNTVNFPAPFSIVAAARATGATGRVFGARNNNWLHGWHAGSRNQFHYDSWVLNGNVNTNLTLPYIYSASVNGSTSNRVFENGTMLANTNGGFTGPNGFQLNGYALANELSNVDIFECFIYNAAINDNHRGLVEGSLSDRFNIPITSYIADGSGCVSATRATAVASVSTNYFNLPDSLFACGDSLLVQADTGYTSYAWSAGSNTRNQWVKTAGWVRCTVTGGACGGTQVDSVFVNLIFNNIIQNDTAICQGTSVQLRVNSNAGTNWTKLYETTNPSRDGSGSIVYLPGFGKTGGAASSFSSSINRVRVRMENNVGGVLRWAEVSYDAWTGLTPAGLQVPDMVNGLVVQRNVFNVEVTSNMPGVNTGRFDSARVEMWPWNYSPATSGLLPAGNGGIYDWDDTHSNGGGDHGSFQIHNISSGSRQTILAWNMHRAGGPAEIGFGNSSTSNTDYTGDNANGSTNFRVQIFAGINGTSGLRWSTGDSASIITVTPSANTTYYATSTINGRSCTDSVRVTVNPRPVISGTLNILSGGTSQLTATGTPAATNAWRSSDTTVARVSSTGLVTGIGEGTAIITYTNLQGCASNATFTVSILIPTITAITPERGFVDSLLTISGTNFSSTAANNIVLLGSAKANIVSATDTQLVVTIPRGATHAPVTVTNLSWSRTATSSAIFYPRWNNTNPQTIVGASFQQFDITSATTPASVSSGTWNSVRHNGAVADFDSDGRVDLVKVDNTNNRVRVYRNASSAGSLTLSSFTSTSLDFTTVSSPRDVAVGDLNNDGRLDMVVTNGTTSVSVLINTSTRAGVISFAAAQTLTLGSSVIVRIADMDADGRNDIITAPWSGGAISVYRNTSTLPGSTISVSTAISTGITATTDFVTADLNSDNEPEIVSVSGSTLQIAQNSSTRGNISFLTPLS
ncbi:MAG: FG-GAP-like repeat-containing protein, partial [Bacteroidota bacterium]